MAGRLSGCPPKFAESEHWLIVADNVEKLEESALSASGSRAKLHKNTFSETQEFLACLSKTDRWKGVLYFAGSQVEQNCKSALSLVQALISSNLSTHLWFITDSVQVISGSESVNLSQSPLWGMGKTVALEHPELNCACIDFNLADERKGLSGLMSNLMAEISQIGAAKEEQIAYRNGSRYVARLVRHVREQPQTVSSTTNLQLQINQRGTLEQLEWRETVRRSPGPDEIELRVQATGLNFRDVLNALDLYPGEAGPLGLECVGEVVAVGATVETVSIGDVVMAIAPASFSQFVTVHAALAVPKPAHLSVTEAATIPTAFLTAYYTLVHLAELKAGERILIHAAAGGVGQAAVQIAQMIGAEVFATASMAKWEFLQQQGVQHIFQLSHFGVC